MKPMLIPALRAIMGDRVYFVTTLNLSEIARRVDYAKEVHSNKDLNDLIQRRLDEKRGKIIADYLMREEQRFFNALVVGVYAGDPIWQDFGKISAERPSDQQLIPENATNTFGFLRFNGREKLFALDGQHRLAGIKRAVELTDKLNNDRVAVIFVAHHNGPEGLQSTRRLFTVLNKTARPVLKGDIIALDEDDTMAICTRRLINDCTYFNRGQVAMRVVNNLSQSDRTSWTTITMVYDMLTMLYAQIYPSRDTKRRKTKEHLKNVRPDEVELDAYYKYAVDYFTLLRKQFKPVGSALFGTHPAKAVATYRNAEGGNILFRPIGQKIITQIVAGLCKEHTLRESIKLVGRLPTQLSDVPYCNVIWNPDTRTIKFGSTGESLVKDLLLHMLGKKTRRKIDVLKDRYADVIKISRDEAKLPELVI